MITMYQRQKEQDGAYGAKTDILLRNAYRVKLYTKSFTLEEFKCECEGKYCTEYPKLINIELLKNLQSVRGHFGEAITITSGMRCKGCNIRLGELRSLPCKLPFCAASFRLLEPLVLGRPNPIYDVNRW